jgi:hypothetical protein
MPSSHLTAIENKVQSELVTCREQQTGDFVL